LAETNNGNPRDHDWVRARAGCALHSVFAHLVEGVKSDLAARQELSRELDQGIHFAIAEEDERNLVVSRNLRGTISTVEFSLGPAEIVVGEDGLPTFSATVALNENGECTLVVDGNEMEMWKVRRMALEGLFFHLPPPVTRRSR
jgi:hypothetical protein